MVNSSKYVDDETCKHILPKPEITTPCESKCSVGHWNYGAWSKVLLQNFCFDIN